MELRYYQTLAGKRPFTEWFNTLADSRARRKVASRLARVASGNLGDAKSVGGGVLELRIDWGPGYRIYCARLGNHLLLLLCGGDKHTQVEDIRRAKAYFKDATARSAN